MQDVSALTEPRTPHHVRARTTQSCSTASPLSLCGRSPLLLPHRYRTPARRGSPHHHNNRHHLHRRHRAHCSPPWAASRIHRRKAHGVSNQLHRGTFKILHPSQTMGAVHTGQHHAAKGMVSSVDRCRLSLEVTVSLTHRSMLAAGHHPVVAPAFSLMQARWPFPGKQAQAQPLSRRLVQARYA